MHTGKFTWINTVSELTKSNHLYGINDKPPLLTLVLLSLQYLVKFSLLLIAPIIILTTAQATPAQTFNVLSMTLIASAIATLLIAGRKFGAACFIPAQASVPFFAALLILAQLGGLSLVFGMTIIAGLLQCVLSPLLYYARRLLDEHLAGFIILGLGVWAALLGVSELFRPNNLGQLLVHSYVLQPGSILTTSSLLGFITLGVMLALRFAGRARLYCILVGMLVGWLMALLLGELLPQRLNLLKQAAWFAVPHFNSLASLSFDWKLIPALLLVAVIASLEIFALVGTIENLATSPWQVNFRQIAKGNCAAGLGVCLGGLLGGIAPSPIPGSIGDLIATGAHSRVVAYLYAPLLFILAFSPKFAVLFLTIPAAVNGGAIIFMGAVMIMQGFALLKIPQLPSTKAQAFSLAFLLALSSDIMPQLYLDPRGLFAWNTNYDLVIGLSLFIILPLVFQLRFNSRRNNASS